MPSSSFFRWNPPEEAAKKSAASNKAAEKAETISDQMPYLGLLVPVVLLSLLPFFAFLLAL